jgi:hypothetical protein
LYAARKPGAPIVQLAQIGGTGQDVVVRIERIGTETVAQLQARPRLGHDLHRAHSAFARHGARIATLSTSMTARIHDAGMPNRCDGSAMSAANGGLSRAH